MAFVLAHLLMFSKVVIQSVFALLHLLNLEISVFVRQARHCHKILVFLVMYSIALFVILQMSVQHAKIIYNLQLLQLEHPFVNAQTPLLLLILRTLVPALLELF